MGMLILMGDRCVVLGFWTSHLFAYKSVYSPHQLYILLCKVKQEKHNLLLTNLFYRIDSRDQRSKLMTLSIVVGDFWFGKAHNTWWSLKPVELQCRLCPSQAPDPTITTALVELPIDSYKPVDIRERKKGQRRVLVWSPTHTLQHPIQLVFHVAHYSFFMKIQGESHRELSGRGCLLLSSFNPPPKSILSPFICWCSY